MKAYKCDVCRNYCDDVHLDVKINLLNGDTYFELCEVCHQNLIDWLTFKGGVTLKMKETENE